MSTARILLYFICLAFTGSLGLFDRHLLANEKHATITCRQNLIKVASQEVGVRERTGDNDGKRVEEYLAAVHLKRGNPYCAAFISWVYMQEGFARPSSGWSPDLVPVHRLCSTALPANIFGIYFPELGRVAHVGMIETVQHDWLVTIEANTNVAGSREGEGVYRKRRHLKTIYRMADWIVPERRKP